MASEKQARTVSAELGYIGRLLRKRFDTRAKSLCLTRAQWHVIHVAHFHPGLTQREIAEKVEVGSVAAGRLIDRLEQAGWIERRRDPHDRRAHRVYMADDSAQRYSKLAALAQKEEERALSGMSKDAVKTLRRLLEKIIENLE